MLRVRQGPSITTVQCGVSLVAFQSSTAFLRAILLTSEKDIHCGQVHAYYRKPGQQQNSEKCVIVCHDFLLSYNVAHCMN